MPDASFFALACVPALPRNALGKVLKNELQARFLG